jgi:hypothetical protein
MSDNEEDAKLVDFIERQHGGLFSKSDRMSGSPKGRLPAASIER